MSMPDPTLSMIITVAVVAIFLLIRLTFENVKLEERLEGLEDRIATREALDDFKAKGGSTLEEARANLRESLNGLQGQ